MASKRLRRGDGIYRAYVTTMDVKDWCWTGDPNVAILEAVRMARAEVAAGRPDSIIHCDRREFPTIITLKASVWVAQAEAMGL